MSVDLQTVPIYTFESYINRFIQTFMYKFNTDFNVGNKIEFNGYRNKYLTLLKFPNLYRLYQNCQFQN